MALFRLFKQSMGRWLMMLLLLMLTSVAAKAAEAYACYTPSNTKLTFYYDNQRSSRPGTTYNLNSSSGVPGWYSDNIHQFVTQVVFDPSFADARPVGTNYWFNGMSQLASIIGIEYLNTSEVLSMSNMFYNCSALASLDLSHFDTRNVTNMSNMFNICSGLTSLDVSSFNTANVTEMNSMFKGCSGLTSLDVSGFNTAQVTNMAFMFNGCSGLTSLDLSSFYTAQVTNMYCMFDGCSNLTTIYVGDEWSTDAVTNSGQMFNRCDKLVGGHGTTYSSMYTNATYAHIDGGPSNPGYFTDINAPTGPEAYACYTPSNTTLTFYYDKLRSIREGTIFDINLSGNGMGMLPSWVLGTSSIEEYVKYVVFDPSFANANPTSICGWFGRMENLESITGMTQYLNTSRVTDMTYMFLDCKKLTNLDLSGFNTEKAKYMMGMFSGIGLTELDLSNFNTARVTITNSMFQNCDNLATIYVGEGWSTASVTNSLNMFDGCTSLVGGKGTTYDANHVDAAYAHIDGGPSDPGYFTDINAPAEPEAYAVYTADNTTLTFYYDMERSIRTGTTYGINLDVDEPIFPSWVIGTSSIEEYVKYVVFDPSFADARPVSTFGWFAEMENLQSITGLAQYLNTSQVINMTYIFLNCNKLTNLDLSGFNTDKTTNMMGMFSGCSGLTSLDLSGFNTNKVTITTSMFQNCDNLATIYVGEGWDMNALTESTNMFVGCTSLVGGAGTTYDANHVNADYAHVDGGPSNPGYLTDINAPKAYAVYTSDNTSLTFYYDNQRSTREGTTYDLNVGTSQPGWYSDGINSSVTQVVFDPSFADALPTTTFYWFNGMGNLQSITGMTQYLNTSEVTNMCSMFQDCSSLASIDVSGFNTSKVQNFGSIFQSCSGLTSLDLSNFDASQATTTASMFEGCTGLTRLDLSSLNTANVSIMLRMFYGCSHLATIYVGDQWSTAGISISSYANYMFQNCTSLVGGQGTAYDANHTGKDYAHIDGGLSNPGYFTDANASTELMAYACYTPSNTTLTFYYDTERYNHGGRSYDLNTGNNNPDWLIESSVTRVVFDPSFAAVRPTTTYSWFYDMQNLISITGMEYLNTSEVTNMNNMFWSCSSLTSLDLSHFNTAAVTDMGNMFTSCWSIDSLDLSSFNAANLTNMSYMFNECSGLTSLDMSHFNTEKVTTMFSMFYGCSSLTSLDVSGFNTANVTEMDYMFDGCSGLTSLDVSSFNTANVTGMSFMFAGCSGLTSLDLRCFNTASATNMSGMFEGCSSLTSLDLSSFNTASVEYMITMFSSCSQLETIYVVDNWNMDALIVSADMFWGCSSLVGGMGTTFDADHIDATYAHIDGGPSNPGYFTVGNEAYACYTPSNTTLTFYYDDQRSSREGTTYDLNEDENDTGWDTDGTNALVTKVVFDPSFADARPTTTCDWFYKMEKLESITGISYLNTSAVTTMRWMFEACTKLTNIDLSHFNTSKVTNMAGMFAFCTSLTNLDVSSFNTSQVTNMGMMFFGCKGLKSLDLSSFNTSKVTIMFDMFHYSNSLRTITVSSDWSTAAIMDSGNMFGECTSLVGGMGTTFDADHIDATYAHIDGGPSNPGYFTDINASTEPEAYAVYTADNTTLTFYYDTERSIREGTTFDMPAENSHPGWYDDVTNTAVTQVVFDDSFADARLTTTNYMFYYMNQLTTFTGIENLNTSSVTSMLSMFEGCSRLSNIDLSGFDTENVTNMGAMFYSCNRLTSIDVSGFNTDNVTSMYAMFTGCRALTSLDVSSLNTANVTNMSYMFTGCNQLSSLDLSNFNTGKVRSMQYMFQNCTMLSTIYVGDAWSTTTVNSSDNMFQNCISLVGGQGTAYDANHTGKDYAHIDGGPSNPGYFTEKQAFLLGDVNGDGYVRINDVTALIDYLLSGDGSGINVDAADCNHDNDVRINDVTALIDYLLSGSW